MSNQERASRNTLYGLVALVLWGTTVAVVRSLSERVGPLTAVTAVHLVAGGISLVHYARGGRLGAVLRLHRGYLWGCGLLYVFYELALFLAVGRSTSAAQVLQVGLLNYLWPALTIVLSVVLLGRRARWFLIPGTLLALAGVALVMTPGEVSWRSFGQGVVSNPLAYVLGVCAALSWALYNNLTRRWTAPGDAGAVPLFIIATGVVLAAVRLFVPETSHWSVEAILECGLLGATTLGGYSLWEKAMRSGEMVFVVACSYFTPVLSTLACAVYLSVSVSRNLWLACLLIVAGSLLSWRSVREA